MWVFLRDSFISIVQLDPESRLLQVRARVRGDIEHVFPEAHVAEDDSADYRFTAAISRDRIAQAVALQVTHTDYVDLIEAIHVNDDDRREAYTSVWARMAQEQVRMYPPEVDAKPTSASRFDLEV